MEQRFKSICRYETDFVMNYSDSTSLSVRFRGVRGSIPSAAREMSRYGGNTSCVEIRAGDQILILDAGTGIRNLGRDLAAEFGARPIDASLLISHTHWDHIQGLPFFGPAYCPRNRFRIIAANGRRTLLEQALKGQMGPMYFPVGFERMSGVSEIGELAADHSLLGNFLVDVVALNHPGGCAGFRIETNGKTIGYIPDHEPYNNGSEEARSRQAALVDFVRNMDLLILDTQFSEAEFQKHVGWGHGCLPDSVALAMKGNVRQLALFHHDPSHTDEQVDRMVETARKLTRGTDLVVFGASENKTIALTCAHTTKAELAAQNVLATV
jgi:phosphoribosyl 1,2-cyclic phosphodiesterase